MHFFLDKIARLNCKWNKTPLTQDDFYRLCRRHKVAVVEIPLRVSGFYYCLLGKHYIAVNSRLRQEKKLFVMFHEFAHFLMHAPDDGVTANFHGVGKKTRKENEADTFAICALIPRTKIESSRIQDLTETDGFSLELVNQRLELFHRCGF
ncbi:MAG: ImmA/IrrE family metallo-endopeptidase [Acidobacteria bacterium]|nr:ImmA/IrrE family metallo-endopeptidase [Acidobacteriota bacterium]